MWGATGRSAITRYRLAIAALLVLALAFYMWTAASSIPFTFPSADQDIYNELTTGFLHGHTYLPITPPAGLLHLKNPYDPAQNAPYNAAFHDLSLYHGHFYSQWGPTPVVTLFAPFRAHRVFGCLSPLRRRCTGSSGSSARFSSCDALVATPRSRGPPLAACLWRSSDLP